MPTATTDEPIFKRVPISFQKKHYDELQKLAKRNDRSVSAMARIIYLEGLKTINKSQSARRGK